MKKSLALILSFSMFVIITACDGTQKTKLDQNTLLMLSGIGGPKITYPELEGLGGSTWTKLVFSSSLTQRDAPVGSVTTLEIPIKQQTTTLVFNSDGTFTATFAERYLAAWDVRYVGAGNRTYLPGDHQSSTNAAFVGYTGQFGNGNSSVVWTGTWERRKVPTVLGNEDDYSWIYAVKILHKVSTTYTITETATNYNIINTTFTDDTVSDQDALWSNAIVETSLSDGGASNGTELLFTLGGAFAAPFTTGSYTKI
jgi:hypothetical protein